MMKRKWMFCAAIGLAAIIPQMVYAVDGVVLINQSNALAGNVTPGDAPGFPVTISVPGSYRLSSNLTVPDANTDAIDITTDDVTIDLNGFSIIGQVVCSGFPVTSCSPKGHGNGIFSISTNTAVLNGNVQGMGGQGVSVGFGSRIDKVHVSNNGGGGISVSDRSQVSSCDATSNGFDGIFAANLVSGNIANGNQHNGIYIYGHGSVVSGNSTLQNGSAGISVYCAGVIQGNTAILNAGGNIFTQQSGCVLANNSAP
jgi:hypothetical protein